MEKYLVKGVLIACFILLFVGIANAQSDSLLQELSRVIEQNEGFIREKQRTIEQLQDKLEAEPLSPEEQFTVYKQLHDEYRAYEYDSAFAYALKLQELAQQLNHPVLGSIAKIKLSHTLLSSGMYKEALDSLSTINPLPLPDSIKTDYYALMARTYYDLSGFTQDQYYSPRYVEIGGAYVDSALSVLDEKQLQFFALRGMKNEVEGRSEAALENFKTILADFDPSLNQYAMAANSLGNIYYKNGETEKGVSYMTRAAIADIKASVKEGVALMTLAEYLYQIGQEEMAYKLIKKAMEDADFYGARQRKIQVAGILPVIEGERLATVESQRSRLLIYALLVSILSLLVVVFAFVIFKQLKQLRKAKRIVTEANVNLREVNEKLQQTNAILKETNEKLLEASRIKEEYIGYSFNVYTEYLEKIDKFKKGIQRKLMSRKYEDISHVMESINLKKERENLYQGFDRIFLRLFPNFIPVFNSFFKKEDQFEMKNKELLNIELRIFALIRIGIHDHEQIAKIMEYSVRTIYNYKTKVKNKSLLSNEEFEQKIMEIKAF